MRQFRWKCAYRLVGGFSGRRKNGWMRSINNPGCHTRGGKKSDSAREISELKSACAYPQRMGAALKKEKWI